MFKFDSESLEIVVRLGIEHYDDPADGFGSVRLLMAAGLPVHYESPPYDVIGFIVCDYKQNYASSLWVCQLENAGVEGCKISNKLRNIPRWNYCSAMVR